MFVGVANTIELSLEVVEEQIVAAPLSLWLQYPVLGMGQCVGNDLALALVKRG